MKKQRKLIGVIIGQISTDYQSQLINGMCEVAFQNNYDIAFFSIFAKNYAKRLHQIGEINIYNLINYELLDGIFIVPETLRITGLYDKLIREIHEKFDGPVISLDYELENCINLSIDDRKSMEMMTDHIIDVHHKTNLAIMTGPKTHQHAIRRLDGFLDSIKKHNLTVPQNQIFYGDFWFNEGHNVVNALLALPKMPEAILCTSDRMAFSVCDALKRHNIRVPEDILVTGYDSLQHIFVHNPCITSMELSSKKFGKYAMSYMIEGIQQIPHTDPVDTTSQFAFGESCGCNYSQPPMDFQQMIRIDDEIINDFYNAYNYMMEELVSAADLSELLDRICHYSHRIPVFDKFYLALCDNWDYVGCSEEAALNYNKDYYTSKMHLMITQNKQLSHTISDISFQSSIMLPAIWEDRATPSAFFFNPIHFYDRCFGYVVFTMDNPGCPELSYRDWLRTIGIGFENLRVKNNFRWSNDQLAEFAQIDSLTKIFNRNGFFKYADSFYEQALHEHKELFILMGDLNNLKKINDNFGHIEGDNAIQLCAVAFQRTCSQNEKCFRYGGDEFILLGVSNYTKAEILMFEKSISSYLSAYNEISEKPYPVSISLGYWHGNVDDQHTLDDYIKLADAAMFNIKQQYKEKMKKKEKRKVEQHFFD